MRVFQIYDQKALDAQYNNRAAVPEFPDFVASWKKRSAVSRARFANHPDLAYGDHPRERLDIFPAAQTESPVLVFFHGGYWQAMEKESFHFVAQGFVPENMTTVIAGYPLAPEVSMSTIVDACRKALVWIYHNISTYNGNPARISVTGHSAGGHIAAMLMATNWAALDRRLPTGWIKCGCALSGLFDLLPIQRCYLNAVLGMDEATARQNSPVNKTPVSRAPLVLAVGARESAEYKRQSRELAASWRLHGVPVVQHTLTDHHHFSILEPLVDRRTDLNRELRKLMLA